MRESLILAGILVSLLHIGICQVPPPNCKADSTCTNDASCPEDYPVCTKEGHCCPRPPGVEATGGASGGTSGGTTGVGEAEDSSCADIKFDNSLLASPCLQSTSFITLVTPGKSNEEYCSAFMDLLICIVGQEKAKTCEETIKGQIPGIKPMLQSAGISFDPLTCEDMEDDESTDGETEDDICKGISVDNNLLSSTCAATRIFTLRTPGKTEDEYCSAFMGLIDCVFGEEKIGKCFESIQTKHLPILIAALSNAQIPLNFEPSECMEGMTDDETEDGNMGGSWNTSCLAPSNAGICIQQCPCNDTRMVCCSNGCGNLCLPDLKRCASTSAVFNTVLTSTECIQRFAPVLAARNFPDFCRHFWSGLTCAAREMTADKEDYGKICLLRMGRYITEDATEIIAAIRDMITDTTFAEKAAECEQNPYKETPVTPVTLPPPTGVPATDDVRMCANVSMILSKMGNCSNLLNSYTTPTYTAEYCRSIKEMVYCVARNFFQNSYMNNYMVTKCASAIVRMVESQPNAFISRVQSLLNYEHKKCVVKATVCGGDVEPLEGRTCPRTKCPAKYECKGGHCCPMEKKGVCPVPQGNPICGPKCKKDDDCQDDQKCCNQGCGNRTCTNTESRMKTECEMAFEKAKWQLQKQGICGDGQSETVIPRCDQNGQYLPTQSTVGGRKQCVYENGTAIPGSEHSGNVDCTKVRPGVCPQPRGSCPNGPQTNVCVDDSQCSDGKKCCISVEQGTCFKQCVSPEKAPSVAPVDDCSARQCCPVTLCQGQTCPAFPAALCRINSCGGCTTDFYDADGQVVDCMEGLSSCERQRNMGRKLNSERMKSDEEKLTEYIKQNAPYTEGDSDDDDDDVDEVESDEEEDDDEDDESDIDEIRFDIFNEDDNDDDLSNEDFEEEDDDMYPDADDEDEDDDDSNEMVKKMSLQSKLCGYLNNQNFCLNGAKCVAGASMNMFELCECPAGYYGLRCNSTVTQTFNNTECRRLEARVNMLMKALDHCSILSKVLNFVMTALKPKMFPVPKCTADGKFDTIQTGFLLPKTKKHNVSVSYCADINSGMRIPSTVVAYNGVPGTLDCSIKTEIDIMELPMKCHLMSPGLCDSAGGTSCQYYYNNINRRCEVGPPGRGFNSLTECYQTCGFAKVCSPTDNSCQTFTPVPCDNRRCNYTVQYCDVTVNQQSDKQNGECAGYQPYCLEPMDRGTGDTRMWAYYYNTTNHKCQRFVYSGAGGSRNRFYSMHQCQTECSAQEYKYSGLACPSPRMVAMEMMDYKGFDMCDHDYDCAGDQVCCSNMNNKRCVNPTIACVSGERCSYYGTCDTVCTCPLCDGQRTQKVCGSDGKTYDNQCLLEQMSCRTRRFIAFKSNGECPAGVTNDVQMDCPDFCPAVYEPICVFDMTTSGSFSVHTYGNMCEMKAAVKCQGKKLQIIYPGECQKQCSLSCKPYEDCNGTSCVCPSDCTDEPFKPVCAHPYDNPSKSRTFANVCEMRLEACKIKTLYAILKTEACVKPTEEDMYTCPRTDPNLPNSAEILCDTKTNSRCDDDTQRCCPYGQGTRCLDKKVLVRVKVMKDGVCPAVSALTFDMAKCPESRCRSNSDCDGNGLCCDNVVCSYKTCAAPVVNTTGGLCGQGMVPLPRTVCNATNACPAGGKYVSVISNNKTVGICCVPVNNDEALQSEKVCEAMDWMGLKCQNGGRCVGNLRTGQLCQCVRPYYGALCHKKVPQVDATTEECTEGVFNCFTSPCSVQKCPRYPNASCTDNYCGGCNAVFTYNGQDVTASCEETKCLKLKSQIELITGGMSNLMSMLGDEEVEAERKKRGVPLPVLFDEESEETGEMEDEDKMEAGGKREMLMKFFSTLVETKMRFLPIAPNCTDDGQFKKVQCFMDLRRMRRFCACVNKSGEFNENSPMALRPEDLKCLDTDILPRVCLERPIMNENKTCGGVSSRMYFFNPQQRDCVAFRYNGCDGQLKNKFPDYDTCISFCSSKSFEDEVCKGHSCQGNQMCKVVKGKPNCVEMEDGQTERFSDVGFEPVCTEDGQFERKQCIGQVCACVDPDTGAVVKGPAFNAQNINCTGPGLPPRAKYCSDGTKPAMCREGGNPCRNCDRSGLGGPSSDKLKEDGVCKACTQCPGGQKKVCQVSCTDAKCNGYPEAACTINKCTCALEFKSGNKVINCSSTYAACIRLKSKYEGESSSKANAKAAIQLRCSPSEGYLAKCKDNTCHCLKASSGEEYGPARTGVTIETIDCSEAQKKTNVKVVRGQVTVSNENLADLTEERKAKLARGVQRGIEKGRALKVINLKLKSGSIIAEYDLSVDTNVDSGTHDLPSLVDTLNKDVRDGLVTFEVDGQMYVASDPVVSELLTEEDIETPVEDEKEKDKKTIIIVVVVVAAVLLLAVVIGCCWYQRSKRNSKQKDIPFTDIEGKSNPTYMN